MIITKTKNHRRTVVIIASVVLFIACGVGAIIFLRNGGFGTHDNVSQGVDYNPPTQEQKDAGSTTKGNNINNNTSDPTSKDGSTSTPPAASSGSTVDVTIPYAQQVDTNIRITSSIARVTSDGQCTLTMTKTGSQTFTQTVAVQALSSSSTCQGFTVPVNSLASGTWAIAVAYAGSGVSGNATSSVVVQ